MDYIVVVIGWVGTEICVIYVTISDQFDTFLTFTIKSNGSGSIYNYSLRRRSINSARSIR